MALEIESEKTSFGFHVRQSTIFIGFDFCATVAFVGIVVVVVGSRKFNHFYELSNFSPEIMAN